MSRKIICPCCRTLLAIQSGDQLEIRYKATKYVVKGAESMVATCRNCQAEVTLKG